MDGQTDTYTRKSADNNGMSGGVKQSQSPSSIRLMGVSGEVYG